MYLKVGIIDPVRVTIITMLVLLAPFPPSLAAEQPFPGWQAFQVILQQGQPRQLRAADLDSDGRAELVVVNPRTARLDVYALGTQTQLDDQELLKKDQPNYLPMAPEIKLTEVPLEQIPQDLIIQDLDDDGRPELVVLASPPNQVLVYGQEAVGDWQQRFKLNLLEGEFSAREHALLLRTTKNGPPHLLVSMNNGIQELPLSPSGRAQWLSPREQQGRTQWWLADLDGDGQQDLVEQTRESTQSIRWYRGAPGGSLVPAAVLFDQAVSDAELLATSAGTSLVLLDGTVRQLLRRYRLGQGDENIFGQINPLALEDANKTAWCGMQQAEQRALVIADRNRPRLLSYVFHETGWEPEQAFPAVSDVKALAAPMAERNSLLIWATGAADLLKSRWEAGRLTYPEPMKQSEEIEARKILALSTVGSTTWWVQRVGKHLDLYRWTLADKQPEKLRFNEVGSKAEEVLWIGGERLLVKETHARGLKLAVQEEGKTTITSPTQLKKASLSEYKLLKVGDQLRLGRLVEGVLQWIDKDLQSYEQVMLPQGQELADYIAIDSSAGWALQTASPFIHRMEIGASGLSRAVQSLKVAAGLKLVNDPTLGILLVTHDRITHLCKGKPFELKLTEAVDDRIGQPGGVRETKFHRLGKTDVDGDGQPDLLLYDDLNHRITVLAVADGGLQPIIAWPLFDDKIYPYGEGLDDLVHEPRAVLGLDMDGDQHQDLALLCHDRLLIYFAHKTE